MSISTEKITSQLQSLVSEVEIVIDHIGSQTGLSQSDVEFLREVIFHLDAIIVKIKNDFEKNQNLILMDVVEKLSDANNHLRNVLLHEESCQLQHSETHQKQNDLIFLKLIKRIKQL